MGFLCPKPPSAPSPSDTADAQIKELLAALQANRQYGTINSTSPFSSTTWDTPENGIWTEHQTMDPAVEALIRGNMAQQGSQITAGAAAMDNLDYNAATGFHPEGSIPTMAGGVQPGNVQLGFDRSGFSTIPGAKDFTAEGKNVENALYGDFASHAGDEYDRQQTALQTKLRNQGLQPGDEAYDAAMRDFSTAKNQAYDQAARSAVEAAPTVQSQQLADALRIRGQQFGEAQTGLEDYNTAMGANFGQRLAGAGLANSANQQGFNQRLQEYMTPLEYYNGIVRGNTPSFVPGATPGTMPASGAGAPNMGQLVGQQYTGQLNQYNARQSQANNWLGMVPGVLGFLGF